jgi:hypothetical protein
MTVSLPPRRLGSAAKIFPAHFHVRRIAADVADAAWRKGPGVRAWVWPCGTVMMSWVETDADRYLLRHHAAHLVGTWARGAQEARIVVDLQAARGEA